VKEVSREGAVGDGPVRIEDPERQRELEEKANAIVAAGLERNAHDPVAIDVGGVTSVTEALVILTGNSDRQVRAIADNITRDLEARSDPPLGVEGLDEARWVLIDANDVVVHVFDPDTRELFNLESLWSDGQPITLTVSDGASAASAASSSDSSSNPVPE